MFTRLKLYKDLEMKIAVLDSKIKSLSLDVSIPEVGKDVDLYRRVEDIEEDLRLVALANKTNALNILRNIEETNEKFKAFEGILLKHKEIQDSISAVKSSISILEKSINEKMGSYLTDGMKAKDEQIKTLLKKLAKLEVTEEGSNG